MIELDQLTVRAGTFGLEDVELVVPEGQYGVLMGKTGAGKSTLLEAIAGLKPVLRGAIRLSGRDVTDLRPALRGLGYVPQDSALFRTMTVAENLAFALAVRNVPAREQRQRVLELAELLGIRALLSRRPIHLSGGERQRVALGRAIAFRPRILLLDEPLSAVDEDTREGMYALLKSVQRHGGLTALHVTHNQYEADRLADRRFRLVDGRVVAQTADASS